MGDGEGTGFLSGDDENGKKMIMGTVAQLCEYAKAIELYALNE